MDYGFFYWNPEFLGLGRQIGQINSGTFGVFLAKLSVPILIQWVPSLYFSLFNHYFYKKLSLYIHILNIYLGLGFKCGLQRIRDLTFVCPQSMLVFINSTFPRRRTADDMQSHFYISCAVRCFYNTESEIWAFQIS